ncbi:squalene synthase HpnD [Oligella ureolytica]|uniref:Squalene synthase HpnD n=1 Tax=Oligella ureolytica TaxID=90244 RepID=A0A378XJ63_9BURK|nr:squalene/phytoene synthase family protein [Oligella ureolytica]QPT39872.1 squalene/phytoene synthase family protein [Oligella ureolytica]SUA52003.1 squalene synthase HpnD [Oligella ureolytica]SUA57839.1 squalene synthase HpnD [Oligella ureolytica]
MTPLTYCEDKISRPASSIYYALLTCAEAQQPHLTAILALHKEISEVLIECKEASVARIKLSWWRSELEQSLRGNPSHPITKALSVKGGLIEQLSSDATTSAQLYQLFSELIKATELDLSQGRYLDWPNLANYLVLNGGSLTKLLMWQLLGNHYIPEKHADFAENLAKAIALSIIIRDVGLHSIQGRIYIPMSDLRQFNVTANQIQQRQYADNFKELLSFEAERVMTFFDSAQTALSNFSKEDVRHLRPLLSLGSMYKALLQKILKNPQDVFEHRLNLSPLQKALIAQKHKLSFNKI